MRNYETYFLYDDQLSIEDNEADRDFRAKGDFQVPDLMYYGSIKSQFG